jgi:serine/threonine-protein kinase RsbW
MKKKQPKQHFYFQVNSDLNALGSVLKWFTKVSESYLSSDCFLQCQTMLAEGFTNAVRHAHHNYPPQTLIEIELLFYSEYLEIQIWDSGMPFNLREKLDFLLQEQSDSSVISLAEGGRGLKFIYALTDQFDYIRDHHQKKNCLIMQKLIK